MLRFPGFNFFPVDSWYNVHNVTHLFREKQMYLLSINGEAFYTRCERYDTGCSLVFASIKGREKLDLSLERLQKKAGMKICKSVRIYKDKAIHSLKIFQSSGFSQILSQFYERSCLIVNYDG